MSEASGDWGTIRLRNGLSLEEAAQRLRTLEEPPVLLCPDAGELLDIAVGLMEILRPDSAHRATSVRTPSR